LSRYANHAGARYFLDEGKQTTNLASISMSKVAGLPVPVPPKGIAARIDTLLDTTDTSARILQAEATRALAFLDRLEQGILARAFRGELVHQDADEVSDVVAHVAADQDAPTTRRKIRAVAA
jgi:type I restriction enzyme S subunit